MKDITTADIAWDSAQTSKRRIDALERRVAELERLVHAIVDTSRVQQST